MNIAEFGAVADGKTVNTLAIQAAIDACHANGGGRVVIPAGTYVTGSLFLRSHVELHLEQGAKLIASTYLEDYHELDAYPQNWGSASEEWLGKHLIYAVEQNDIAITGHGTIDGNGAFFFEEPQEIEKSYEWVYGIAMSRDKELLRPGQLISLIECSHVRVEDVTISNTPCWGCFLHGCEYVSVRGIRVFNKAYHANTDGIDIDTCRYVTVSDCIIDTGDDAIAIRCDGSRLLNPDKRCAYITITNCVLASTICAFRIGVGVGEICHVTVSDIVISRASRGMSFMTAYSERGQAMIHDMSFSNITAENVAYPFTMEEENESCIRNITIQNYRAHAYCGAVISAKDPGTVSDIRIRDVDICIGKPTYEVKENEAEERGEYALYCQNAQGVYFENVHIRIPKELQMMWKGLFRVQKCCDMRVRDCNFEGKKNHEF